MYERARVCFAMFLVKRTIKKKKSKADHLKKEVTNTPV
jgi:hypothetical protein